ncbi:MAG: tetratricopeptide repeat protein [Deltaproteobacteria bacterium]|jgi:tetratricopeptide (TPR) repeat protein|nr:tetratricopeptide repeat protein [Deltaproteobacteria bacterium]
MSSWPPLWPRDLRRFSRQFKSAIARFLPDYEFQVGPTPEPDSELAAPLAYQGRSLGYVSVSLKSGCLSAPTDVLALWPRLADSALENIALRKALQKDPDSGLYNRRHFMARLRKLLRSFSHRPGTFDPNQVMDSSSLIVAVISLGQGKKEVDRSLTRTITGRKALCLARLDRDRLGLLFRAESDEADIYLHDFRNNLLTNHPHLQPSIGYARWPQELPAQSDEREAAAGLLEKAEMALFFAAGQQAPARIIGYRELVEKYGHLTQVLPQERVIINLGRAMGARAGQIYAVISATGEPKGEISVFETADNYALANVLSGGPTRLAAGDGLIFSRLDLPEDCPPVVQAGDDSQGQVQRKFLETLSRLASSGGQLVAALIAVDDKEKLEALAGTAEVERRLGQIKTVASKLEQFQAASEWDRGTVAVVWSQEPVAVSEISRQFREELEFPVSLGLVAWPSSVLKADGIITAAKKALLEASMTGPSQAIVFGAQCLNISGDHYFEEGDLPGAMEEYRRGLILEPGHINLLNSLGVCHGRLSDHKAAAACFDEVLKIEPENLMALFNKGCSLIMSGRLEEAAETLGLAVKLPSPGFEVFYQHGRLLLELGHPEEARESLLQAAALKDRRGAVYRLLGQAELLTDHQKEALEAFKQAVKYDPDDAPSLSSLGILFLEQANDREVALSLFQRSVEIDPTNSLFRQRLGKLFFELGDFIGAKHHLKAAVDYGCRVPDVYKRLDELSSSSG